MAYTPRKNEFTIHYCLTKEKCKSGKSNPVRIVGRLVGRARAAIPYAHVGEDVGDANALCVAVLARVKGLVRRTTATILRRRCRTVGAIPVQRVVVTLARVNAVDAR